MSFKLALKFILEPFNFVQERLETLTVMYLKMINLTDSTRRFESEFLSQKQFL